MKRRISWFVAGLAVALAACADAGSTPVSPDAVAPRRSTDPSVSLYCNPDGQWCEATASGGSGSGYTFDWAWPVNETYDADGVSGGDVVCYPSYGWFTISVSVTDGNGRTGYASTYHFCPP